MGHPGFCLSTYHSGGADAAGLGTRLWVAEHPIMSEKWASQLTVRCELKGAVYEMRTTNPTVAQTLGRASACSTFDVCDSNICLRKMTCPHTPRAFRLALEQLEPSLMNL